MTLTQIRNLTKRKTGRNNRSMLEHLFRIEEEITPEINAFFGIANSREKIKKIFQKYKAEHHISNPFTYETVQEYFLTASNKTSGFPEQDNVGLYTSTLVEQIEGDHPIIIDLQGKTFNRLLYGLNTPRHVTVQNVKGEYIGSFAGDNGIANIHFKSIIGNFTGSDTGRNRGNATTSYQDINGHSTGAYAGSHGGKILSTYQNVKGGNTGRSAGFHGNSTIVAYNVTGESLFYLQEGKLVFKNSDKIKIEGIYDSETRRQIQRLIAQNATPQEILDYIEANK